MRRVSHTLDHRAQRQSLRKDMSTPARLSDQVCKLRSLDFEACVRYVGSHAIAQEPSMQRSDASGRPEQSGSAPLVLG